MCDFKPGDEVVRYRDSGLPPHEDDTTGVPPVGHIGHVLLVIEGPDGWVIDLDNWPACPFTGLLAEEFRKVQKRDLQAWLSTAAPAPHLDKRPKKRVPA